MAVNLLSLAKQLGGSLHSTPKKKRSSRRSSYQNQPSNLQRGTHIPGTGIKQNKGLASKGRRGDTKIRRVKGEPSHVNTAEARAIDTLGPIGEAWVQSVGSGTINPKTGLREYGWLSDAFKGDYTSMGGGKTKARRKRDLLKLQSRQRHKNFETFRQDFENENIAGIFTKDSESEGMPGTDDTPLTKDWAGKFDDFITTKSGLNNPGGFIDKADISNYTDPYDPRKEDELIAEKDRELERTILQEDALDRQEATAFSADTSAQKETGAALSSGLFGMLTQSQEEESQKGFAGSGNFAQDFQKKMAIQSAERSLDESTKGRVDTQEDITGKRDEIDINTRSAMAETQAGIADLQENYNQEFWQNMISWESAINA